MKREKTLEAVTAFAKQKRIVVTTEGVNLFIAFPDRPADTLRSTMKEAGWRWVPEKRAWRNVHNSNTVEEVDAYVFWYEELMPWEVDGWWDQYGSLEEIFNTGEGWGDR